MTADAEGKPDLAALAANHGFDTVGVCAPDAIGEAGSGLADYLSRGFHGAMGWMAERAEQRGKPSLLWPEVRSIIVLGLAAPPALSPLAALEERNKGFIATYAQGQDYHDVIKPRLKAFARDLIAGAGGGEAKVFVDTAPVMEKPLAEAAGLGWQGKHTVLVSRQAGSWLLLGVIYTTIELTPDEPHARHCGTCSRCLDICPTAAFPAPFKLDARRCLAYLTIEHKGPIPHEFRAAMGNRIFGCDDCLAVCPWNRFAREAREARLRSRRDIALRPLAELLRLDDPAFRALFAKTPVKRTGRDRFVRNCLIAAGNSGDLDLIETVTSLMSDASPLVRGAAIWALARLAPARLGKKRPADESDAEVLAEWRLAIGEQTG